MKNNPEDKMLFVIEKWSDGNPKFGATLSFWTLLNTFSKCCPHYQWNVIHMDESYLVFGKHVDSILPDYCKKYGIKVICFSMLGQSHMNPSLECIQTLKNMGIKLIFTWPDSNPQDLSFIDKLGDLSDLNVYQDAPASPFHTNRGYKKNDIVLWTPIDSRLFFPHFQNKQIDVLFIGRRYPLRDAWINEVKKVHPQLFVTGGQREVGLTQEQYAAHIQLSKMVINFAQHPFGYDQVKGRALETIASGSLLLESSNEATRRMFEPDVDYVSFENVKDLCDKISFYLANEEKRLEICKHAYETHSTKYSAIVYWKKVMERIEND
jgi:hypothetical protein